ncbi:MAG: EhaG family protein [Methanocellales archaeon]|nr:EhaG family protein [Methanocellales archaeon]
MEIGALFQTAIVIGFASAFIAFLGFVLERDDVHKLVLTDLIEVLTLMIVACVGTDLAECLILPALVVGVAEVLAFSELAVAKEKTRLGFEEKTQQSPLNIEVLRTSPNLIAIILILYGAVLTGFTGGAVAGLGMLYYLVCRWEGDITKSFWEGVGAVSGVAWCLWILGFLLFFIVPDLWLLALFLAGGGILVKVTSKMGLIGIEGKRSFRSPGGKT